MIRKTISSGRAKPAPSRRTALRAALAGVGAVSLAGCDRLSNNAAFVDVLKSAQNLSHGVQRIVAGRKAMAQEFSQADVAAHFKANGTLMPTDADYQVLVKDGFKDWKLQIGGLVEKPAAFTLAELRAMPARTQITRHDCVEGWSCIGQWKGVRMSHLLNLAQVRPEAKFAVFHCLDMMEEDDEDTLYYESVDLDDAFHEQTILAWELNGKPLPVENGAPLRARIERQLGYKQPKYLHRVELVASFDELAGGKGGYWEDQGYNWYGGI